MQIKKEKGCSRQVKQSNDVVLLRDVNGGGSGLIFLFPVVLLALTAGYGKSAPYDSATNPSPNTVSLYL